MYPQITKNYAAGNMKDYYNLMIRGGKFAFIVLSVLMIPILINTEHILTLWLKNPPENSALFVILVLMSELIRMTSEPLYTGIQATGNIKNYQIFTNVVSLLNLPISYILLKIFKEPTIVFYTTICVSVLFVLSRMYFIHKLTAFPSCKYATTLLFKCIIPFIISYTPMLLLNSLLTVDFCSFIITSIISLVWTCLIFYILSFNKQERSIIIGLIFKRNG